MIEFYECLRRIEIIMMRAMSPKLQDFGFSKTEIFILTRLYFKKEARMTELARTLGIPSSSFTSIIDRLVKRKMVVRENDPNDRRSVIIRGTQELQKKVKEIFGIANEVFSEVLEPVPESLMERVTADLNELLAHISTDSGDDIPIMNNFNEAGDSK